jgi:hypothetical protein
VPRADHRIDRFTDAHGYSYCGVCHRRLMGRSFFTHPELDPDGPGAFTQIERHVGDPLPAATWAGLAANGLKSTPHFQPDDF